MHYLERFVALAVHAQCGQQKFLGIFFIKVIETYRNENGYMELPLPQQKGEPD
jgi:hypothetical protein